MANKMGLQKNSLVKIYAENYEAFFFWTLILGEAKTISLFIF
jgi:hypothetical protein